MEASQYPPGVSAELLSLNPLDRPLFVPETEPGGILVMRPTGMTMRDILAVQWNVPVAASSAPTDWELSLQRQVADQLAMPPPQPALPLISGSAEPLRVPGLTVTEEQAAAGFHRLERLMREQRLGRVARELYCHESLDSEDLEGREPSLMSQDYSGSNSASPWSSPLKPDRAAAAAAAAASGARDR